MSEGREQIMPDLADRLADVRRRIRDAERNSNRPAGSVRLLAVSKEQPSAAIEAACALGQTCFGESYLQEAVQKMDALRHLSVSWHFIGRIQTNKTRILAERFEWVHSLDRLKIAERLDAQRPVDAPPLNVCLQINLDREGAKGGVGTDDVYELTRALSEFRRIRLRGLMAIPMPQSDSDAQFASFQRMKVLFDDLKRQGVPLDTLSMGMTGDFEAAIAAGATIVRIGSAIFGPRSR